MFRVGRWGLVTPSGFCFPLHFQMFICCRYSVCSSQLRTLFFFFRLDLPLFGQEVLIFPLRDGQPGVLVTSVMGQWVTTYQCWGGRFRKSSSFLGVYFPAWVEPSDH